MPGPVSTSSCMPAGRAVVWRSCIRTCPPMLWPGMWGRSVMIFSRSTRNTRPSRNGGEVMHQVRRMLLLVLLLLLLQTPHAHAQLAVLDVANLAQNVIQAIQTILIVAK